MWGINLSKWSWGEMIWKKFLLGDVMLIFMFVFMVCKVKVVIMLFVFIFVILMIDNFNDSNVGFRYESVWYMVFGVGGLLFL